MSSSTCYHCSKLPSLLTCQLFGKTLSLLLLSSMIYISKSFISTDQAKFVYQPILIPNALLPLVDKRKKKTHAYHLITKVVSEAVKE